MAAEWPENSVSSHVHRIRGSLREAPTFKFLVVQSHSPSSELVKTNFAKAAV